MTNFILIAVLAVICGAAARYIYKEKKRGAKCIGCHLADGCGSCNGGQSCNGGCGGCGTH